MTSQTYRRGISCRMETSCGISAAGRRIRKEASNDSRRSRRERWAARPGLPRTG